MEGNPGKIFQSMNILTEIPAFLAKHKKAALCIVTHTDGSTPRKPGSKMLVAADGSITGTVGGGSIEMQVIHDARNALNTNIPVRIQYNLEADLGMKCGGTVEVYIEPMGSKSRLYIFGAGHVGKALARFANQVDFEITLLDFRPIEFTEQEKQIYRFAFGDYFESLETIDYDDDTYIAIMSPSHEHDFELLKRLGKKQFAYMGMIGSIRKVARAREILIDETHHFTAEEFSAFDTPMGLKMAAETPEEIAISILGKIIDVRNKKLQS
jgi:xanthine dehydrogenase accessory factor